ncbi:MAG: hypothetical protein HY561_13745 [Gemmatimonadetes bacterium]|nr:hypothetical protein [Gemmatimonadota bacterium]
MTRGGAGGIGVVIGRITVVQEDRVRIVDDEGRGYLLVVRKRAASLDELEHWRDGRVRLRVYYTGAPDAGGLAQAMEAVRSE